MPKKIAIIALLVIAIIAVAGAATYIVQQRQEKGAERVRQVEEPVATLPKIPEIDTSDWKVYRNEKYGFEVRYPREWQINIQSSEGAFLKIPHVYATPEFEEYHYIVWYQAPESTDEFPRFLSGVLKFHLEMKNPLVSPNRSSYNGAPFGIFIRIYNNLLSEAEIKRRYYDYSKQTAKFESIQVSGIEGLRVIQNTEDEIPEVWAYEDVVLAKPPYTYVIFYAGDEYRDYFKRLLSTFKFIR